MEIEVYGDEEYGNGIYTKLFDEIMSDLNKAYLIDRVKLVLKPSTPLFVFSIVLKPPRDVASDFAIGGILRYG